MSETSLQNNLRNEFQNLSKEIMPKCGLIYELYQQRLSAEIDRMAATLAVSQRKMAIELARDEFDYLSPSERESQKQGFKQNGLCLHGLDPDCCPCGCGM